MMRDEKNVSPFFSNSSLEDTLRLQAFLQMERRRDGGEGGWDGGVKKRNVSDNNDIES